MRPTTCVLLLLFLVSCQNVRRSPAGGVRLTADETAYAPGSDVLLQLVNETDGVVGYNLCMAALEQETPDGWQPAGESEMCTMIQNGLEPGDSAAYTKTLAADLPAGRYRYATDVERRATGRREQVATDAFAVE